MPALTRAENDRNPLSWLTSDWPYWAGGIAIALLNTALMVLRDRPWGITSVMAAAGGRTLQLLGFTPELWGHFADERGAALANFTWLDEGLWLNLGLILGAALASLWSGEWFLRRPRSWRTVGFALGGGLLMGYGARLALGCNAGALLGGIPSLSIHGWVFALFTFGGALAGLKLFRRVL